jgi:4-hydroxybenzoate polyprenyltransferase
MSKIFSFLTITSIWVAFTAAFGPILLCQLSGQDYNYVAALLVFLVTFAIYSLDKVSGSAEDLLNSPERACLAGWPVAKIAIVAYLAAIVIVSWWDIAKLPCVLIPGLAGALYTARIAGRRPKDLPGAKSLIVATATAICYAGLIDGAAWQYILIFLLTFIDTVIFDIRDIIGDKANGVRTIPVILGTSRTLAMLAIACLVLACISPIVAAVGLGLIWYFRKERAGWEYDLLVDGWMIWAWIISVYTEMLK